MSRDQGLEELIRDELRSLSGVTEKGTFGGWAWLLGGNLLCCARDDGMLVRLGKGRDAWALELDGVATMMSGSRIMHGWVRCGAHVYGDDDLRRKLLAHAIEFVRSLPPK
jgi:hypothetical protein